MLTQRQIDEIINASRRADEGPTSLARRIEAAVMLEVSKEIDTHGGEPEDLADTLRSMWQDSLTPRPEK
jgi:hypothetical protein